MAVKMLNVPSLPNIPWQEKPADYKLSSKSEAKRS